MKKCCFPKTWVKFFKAASDSHRQLILSLIKGSKIINATQIVKKVGLSQPTVSHHLKILQEASLVVGKKKGKEIYYSLNQKAISSCCLGFVNKLIK